jgi:hypothetical protein
VEQPSETQHTHQEKIHDLRQIYEIHRGTKPAATASRRLANRMTPRSQTDKLELAQSGNDLSVASIAKLANRGSAEGVIAIPH